MLRVLLAEDNLADVLLVKHALQEHAIEHELHIVHDGEAALEFVAHMGQPGFPPCPDVLLLDLNLPKVDGCTVLREFRRRPECQTTPVIVVTSSDLPRDRAYLKEHRINRYFRKPSDYDEFLELGAIVRAVAAEPAA